MLRVTAIEKIGRCRYLVSIDRDGIVRTYVFLATDPEFGTCMVSPPEAFLIDIDDYWPKVPFGEPPSPAPPAWQVPRQLVRKLVLGQAISLPVIIEE